MLHGKSPVLLGVVTTLVVTTLVAAGTTLAGTSVAATVAAPPTTDPPADRVVSMPDGGQITVAPNGDARRTDTHGTLLAQASFAVSPGGSALGESWAPSDAAVRARFAAPAPSAVLAVLSDTTAVTGAPVADGNPATGARAALTSNLAVNSAFARLGADSVRPLFGQLPAVEAQRLAADARSRLGTSALDLSRAVVVHLRGGDPAAAASTLRATPGVAFAEPDRFVSGMATDPTPLPSWAGTQRTAAPNSAVVNSAVTNSAAGALPTNYGLTSSLQSFLNAGGVNAMGAYSELGGTYHQLPGAGELITNVSIGDLTDQSMAAAGDPYVLGYGPTTVLNGGQRYLDLPSLPLIPTYTASPAGTLDPAGSTEYQDPTLGEVMLDFGVMAPLPHDQQRAGAVGSGATDLLGIAPGAQYRLVVPQQPTTDQVAVALLAAARQNPKPDVISASLGFGTDAIGFPSRYLEDDPLQLAVIAAIVQLYHIVVCISANDGTRLFTPAAVGPDGGSTPTDVTRDPFAVTSIADDALSTTPSKVLDSGAIAVGGSTLDDTIAAPPQSNNALSRTGTFATTRTDGGTDFSSGFGTRINVSAPSDGIPAFVHPQRGTPQAVLPVLSGGTSASAPMTAAAAAVVLQAARLTARSMSPDDVRSALAHTGRAVATPPQADQQLTVGPQVDVTAAVNSVLGDDEGRDTQQQSTRPSTTPQAPQQQAPQQSGPQDNGRGQTQIVRVSVAHRQTIGRLGGRFTEATDPTRIDLTGPAGRSATGEGLVGPVTIGADVIGLPIGRPVDYVLSVGGHEFHSATPAIRLTPTELLTAAGLPVLASADRTVALTIQVRAGHTVLASADQQLTIGGTDGAFAEALAPVVPATVPVGASVPVHYDLTGVRNVAAPELVVSTVGHWSPVGAPLFTAAYTVALTGKSGTITVPASAFGDGAGSYGIGIVQNSTGVPPFGGPIYGEFAPILVTGGTPTQRPDAPTLAAAGSTVFGHQVTVTRAAPDFALRYDVRDVPGASGAAVEVSAPAPTVFNSLNTVSNPNGTTRDHDGVNAGSVAYQPLPGSSGTAALNALTLGLSSSDQYNVRVFATDRAGHLLGQASPTSALAFDDGRAPNGGTVASFAVVPGGGSVVAVRDPSGAESVQGYQPATGTYGPVFASDAAPAHGFTVLGVDGGAHRLLLLHWTMAGATLETYDTASTAPVASLPVPAEYKVGGGRVDAVHHRGVLLVHRVSDRADLLLTVDLASDALGPAIPADAAGIPAGTYGLIDVNKTTGEVYLSRQGGSVICFAGGPGLAAGIDLGSGTITPAPVADGCAGGIGVDEATNMLYQSSYRSFSANLTGNTNLIPLSGTTLTEGTPLTVRQQPNRGLVVDGAHHLALVVFRTPPGQPHFGSANGAISDNNATSQLAVVDLTSGRTVSVVSGFNVNTGYFGGEFNGYTDRYVQLDPATRTGWTYSGDGQQVQTFSY